MEAMSTTHPVSTLLPKSFISNNHHHPLHLLKPPLPSNSNANIPPHFSTNFINKTSHSLKPTLSTTHPSTFSPPPAIKPSLQTHRKAATGYAAALLDVACCDAGTLQARASQGATHLGGVLAAVAKDARRVKRIVRVVLADERVEEEKKGEVVKMAVEGRGFYKKLVVLVKMLVGKGKVGVVEEVMEEFGRLWEQLCGIKVRKSEQPRLAP